MYHTGLCAYDHVLQGIQAALPHSYCASVVVAASRSTVHLSQAARSCCLVRWPQSHRVMNPLQVAVLKHSAYLRIDVRSLLLLRFSGGSRLCCRLSTFRISLRLQVFQVWGMSTLQTSCRHLVAYWMHYRFRRHA